MLSSLRHSFPHKRWSTLTSPVNFMRYHLVIISLGKFFRPLWWMWWKRTGGTFLSTDVARQERNEDSLKAFLYFCTSSLKNLHTYRNYTIINQGESEVTCRKSGSPVGDRWVHASAGPPAPVLLYCVLRPASSTNETWEWWACSPCRRLRGCWLMREARSRSAIFSSFWIKEDLLLLLFLMNRFIHFSKWDLVITSNWRRIRRMSSDWVCMVVSETSVLQDLVFPFLWKDR